MASPPRSLPVWLLLAPRDALSTFVKLGTILRAGRGHSCGPADAAMPPLTTFTDGTGPIFAGKIFPFCFITIACGAISGFHSLISSGTTPKMLTQGDACAHGRLRRHADGIVRRRHGHHRRLVLKPGIYFAVNSPGRHRRRASPQQAAATISGWGFPVTAARDVGPGCQGRRNDACSTAPAARPRWPSGMAHIFAGIARRRAVMGIWYHFAIMFEALFILTILDAGTRVGRFMLQDFLGHFWKPLGTRELVPEWPHERADVRGLGLLSVPGESPTRSAASTASGRSSASRTSCSPPSPSASAPPC